MRAPQHHHRALSLRVVFFSGTRAMKRLLVLLAAVCTFIAATRAAEPAAPEFFPMDTAVRSLDLLDTMKQLGFPGISWKGGQPEALAQTVKELRARNLKLYAIYSGATLTRTALTLPSHLVPGLPELKGTDAIVWLPIFSKEFPCSAEEGDTIAVPALVQLADAAATHGLRVAIYPHKNAWAERVQDAVRLAKKVNRPNLGATFNLCHCLMVGDESRIPELLEQSAPHLFAVTINGADAGAPGTSWSRLIRPLDEGTYDTRIVLNKLRALKYRGPIGLQAFGIALPPEENLRRSLTAWTKLQSAKR